MGGPEYSELEENKDDETAGMEGFDHAYEGKKRDRNMAIDSSHEKDLQHVFYRIFTLKHP